MSNAFLSSPTLTNVTFSQNSGYTSGGMFNINFCSPILTNVTFSGNSATSYGGGITNLDSSPTIRNTIFWGNTAGYEPQIYNNNSFPVISDSVVEGGYLGTNIIPNNPNLGTLGNYGGLTPTIPLLPDSSAIDAGNGTDCPTHDQRDAARVGTCDIGAFESGGFTLATTTGNNQSTLVSTAFATSLQVTVTSKASPAEPVDGGQVTFTPPASGASASLTGSPATIVGGAASVNASANGTPGDYNVKASANSANSMDFALRNIGTPIITWGNPNNIVYGTALGYTQLNGTADIPGTFTYSPIAGTVLTVGTPTLHVDFIPNDAVNYTDASKDVSITVTQATPVITWSNPANIVFGTPLSATQLNAIADVLGTFIYSPIAGTVLIVGTHTLYVDFTPTDTTNYTVASKNVSITIDVRFYRTYFPVFRKY